MYDLVHVSGADSSSLTLSPLIKLQTSCCDHILLHYSTARRHISTSAAYQPQLVCCLLLCCLSNLT